MKSSTGQHYIALDHVRALAIFLVFTWHFTHGAEGTLVARDYVPIFPLSLIEEGHTGVALFMTLSGYLFAKLLAGKDIDYFAFLWNRALRLLPLLTFVLTIISVRYLLHGGWVSLLVETLANGVILPTLPHGGWSITVEFHFYLIMPVLLYLMRRSVWLALYVVFVAICLRTALFIDRDQVQQLAYHTILGRVDQFALGMMLFQVRHLVSKYVALITLVIFAAYYQWFNIQGGNYGTETSWLWIFHTTIEGAAYAILIAWYDGLKPSMNQVSRFIGKIGEYSYAIYLLHFFFVWQTALLIDKHIMSLSNFYVALPWAFICFLMMVPIGYLSYRFIESPFLRMRRPYTRSLGVETLEIKARPL